MSIGPGATALTRIPVPAELARQGLRHVVEGGLGEPVDRLPGEPQDARGGADVDHRPYRGSLQVLERVAKQEEGRPDIDGDVLVEAFDLPLPERHMSDDRSVVHDAVDGAEAANRLGDDAAGALRVREIGRDAVRLTAGLPHGTGARVQQLAPAPDEDDVGTGRPEPQRRGCTDARAGTGHHDDRAAQAQIRKPTTTGDRRRVHGTSLEQSSRPRAARPVQRYRGSPVRDEVFATAHICLSCPGRQAGVSRRRR